MADVIGLSDVSSPDTGKGKQLKTGNLKRRYNMPRGGKLSYKSLSACLKSAKSDSDKSACQQYFSKEKENPKKKRLTEVKPMNETESKVWSKYIGQGSLARSRMSKNEVTILDSLIKDKLKRLED